MRTSLSPGAIIAVWTEETVGRHPRSDEPSHQDTAMGNYEEGRLGLAQSICEVIGELARTGWGIVPSAGHSRQGGLLENYHWPIDSHG